MKSYEERTKDNQYKIDMFRTKQGLPYEAKVKYMPYIEERGPMENDAFCPNCGARMDGGGQDE